jgi:hypothetical protein
MTEERRGQTIPLIQIQHRINMEKDEKIKIIIDKINQIDMHIGWIQSNIDGGYLQKDGQPSFESILENFINKKESLQNEILTLTNQG